MADDLLCDEDFNNTFIDPMLIDPMQRSWVYLVDVIGQGALKKFEKSLSLERSEDCVEYLVNLKWSVKRKRSSIGNDDEGLGRIVRGDVGGRLKRRKGRRQTKQDNGGKTKKRPAVVVLPRPPPPLPESFREHIVENLGGSDLVLVIQKQLFFSDVNPSASRLSIPFSQLENNEFLTKKEVELLSQPKSEGIEAWLVEPSMEATEVKLNRWVMNNNKMYVIKTAWNSVVKNNGLEQHNVVQLWSFRVNSGLCFALLKL